MEPTNDQPLKTKNNGPMDKVIKEEADNQNGESSEASTSGSTPPLAQSQQGSAHVPRNPVDTQEEADNQNGENSQASTSESTPPLAQGQQGSAHVPRDPVDKQEEADNQNEEISQASTSGSTPPLAQSQQGSAHMPHNPVYKQEEADNQNGESSQASTSGSTPPLAQGQQGSAHVPRDPVDKQVEEPHATHSFEWSWGDIKPTTCTCKKAGTVENLLKRSPQFNKIAKKNNNKELVILRDGRAISSHFPCCLIKNELLSIKYVEAVDKPKQPESQRKGPSGDLVTFHLLTRGGKKVVKIMRNPALKDFQEMTVYAYKDEKVEQALRGDGRLQNTVFKKDCALSHKITESTTEMSSLVDDLDGKTFKIILLDKSSPPASQPGSLDDAYMVQTGSQRSVSDENQDPQQQSSTTESVDENTPKKNTKPDGNKAPEKMSCEIPNSKTMQNRLVSEIRALVKVMKVQQGSKRISIQNLFRVDYGKNAQTCREVKTMKELMKLSDSVCQVRIKGKAKGSGFLLFDKFVLTNGHVVRGIFNESTGKPYKRVTVHFSFESLGQMESGAAVKEVKEVAGFELCDDESGHKHDWALLSLGDDQTLPDVLLTRFGFLPQIGAICIIGHPDGGVKKIDPCLIIPTENRIQVVEKRRGENPEGVEPFNPYYRENLETIQLITDRFFDDASNDKSNRQALSYESCFYFGSSGSPVFDEHCNVVAMHSGGYAYSNARGETQSVIEYGYPLSIITEHIIVQMVKREKFDVLKKYLACSYEHHRDMMTNVKKLVESRNLLAFKNAANNSVVTNDESLKAFFDFISQREEQVPMDCD
ncbi:protein FAM111A-like isoform X2 [Sebastes umbrosus]|uniref:protein FAM111A-like isoform X2 n=1 Tax=Sebastes umbrosus TaxID=72105 RepID=UPI00189FFDF2|nr:protein FAM111A-like isoform X2 [Sebastes umbrosus]